MTDVLIAGGGTGGHLFPGIALAEELRRRDGAARILFVGTAKGIEARAVPAAGFDLALIPVSGLRGKTLLGLLRGLSVLPWALWRALGVVRKFRPQVAVSVGGYAAGPAVLASRLLGRPCVVMEQNAVPGITNRILGRLARRVIAGLPTTGFPAEKVRFLGNPVRRDVLTVRDKPYPPQSPWCLFVFGGSQGARALNDVMVEAAPLLSPMDPPPTIIHQTGKRDVERVRAAYLAAGLTSAEVTPFIRDMGQAYERAHLVLSRAGAMTIAELTACGRPAILVPFPFATDDHQTANAKTLAAAGAALFLPQTELTAAQLVEQIRSLQQNPDCLSGMAHHSRELGRPNAARDIADAVEEVRRNV